MRRPFQFLNRELVNGMSRSTFRALLLAAAALTAWGCDNTLDNPVKPTTPVTVTDTFSSSLPKNGAVIHTFSVTTAGSVVATLTSLSDTTLTVGLDLGTFNGITCATQLSNAAAGPGTSITGLVSGIGSLCVRVYDAASKLTNPIDYTVTVTHP